MVSDVQRQLRTSRGLRQCRSNDRARVLEQKCSASGRWNNFHEGPPIDLCGAEVNLNEIGSKRPDPPFKYLPFPHLQTNATTFAVSSADINYSAGYICPPAESRFLLRVSFPSARIQVHARPPAIDESFRTDVSAARRRRLFPRGAISVYWYQVARIASTTAPLVYVYR